MRIVLGVFVGFIVWSFLWIGSDELLAQIFPSWYGADRVAYFEALQKGEPFVLSSTILLISLVRGTFITLLTGWLASTIAKENARAPLYLGAILLATGIYAHSYSFSSFPIWYHLLFLGMLVPASMMGSKLWSK